MPYMYILKCNDGSFYTGSTWDLERRLAEHNYDFLGPSTGSGTEIDEIGSVGANYTRKRRPVELVYFEQYDFIKDAFNREKQVQGWSRKKKLALIEDNKNKLIELSKNYSQNQKNNDPRSLSLSKGRE